MVEKTRESKGVSRFDHIMTAAVDADGELQLIGDDNLYGLGACGDIGTGTETSIGNIKGGGTIYGSKSTPTLQDSSIKSSR